VVLTMTREGSCEACWGGELNEGQLGHIFNPIKVGLFWGFLGVLYKLILSQFP